ncbi:MAG: glycosyltransferase family 4 protein [Candidatus Woesebacteria bacterium]|jgi:glycosyltransferase involved in cell wall biosynthesis
MPAKSILIISPFFSPNIGGVESHLDDLCKALVEKNYFVKVLTYQPLTTSLKAPSLEKKKNLTIRRLNWPGGNLFHQLDRLPAIFNFFYLTPGLFLFSLFFMLKNKKQISLIHSHGIVATLIAIILKKIFHKPVIVSTHTIYNFKKKNFFAQIVKKIFQASDQIISLSDQSKQEIISVGVKPEKVARYCYWVDQKIFQANTAAEKIKIKTKLGLPQNFTVLFVGRLIKIKGVELLLKIAHEIEGPQKKNKTQSQSEFKKLQASAKKNKISFVFVGNGPLEKKLQAAAQKHKHIFFFADLENKKLAPFYQAADVLVVPSLYQEGFGRVILEALACALPIIASDRAGIKEALSIKQTRITSKHKNFDKISQVNSGFLIEPNLAKIKKKILHLYSRPDLRKKMSKAASQLAKRKYSAKNINLITKQYEKISKTVGN